MESFAETPTRETRFICGLSLEIHQGDITQAETDAIVNAANKHLQHGGGVARAISLRGGSVIQKESDDWVSNHGPIDARHPAYTSGGKMPCKFVIHAVGPIWGEGDEEQKLYDAIHCALSLSEELDLQSISFPAISTGIYSFPVERAAKIFMQTIADYMSSYSKESMEHIAIVLFDTATLKTFLNSFDTFPWSHTI